MMAVGLSLFLFRAAYNRLRLRPRVLRDVSSVDTTCTVLGVSMAHPIGISPTGNLRHYHNNLFLV